MGSHEMRRKSSLSIHDARIAGLYDLEHTIGKGHFAVVKLARHVFTGEKVTAGSSRGKRGSGGLAGRRESDRQDEVGPGLDHAHHARSECCPALELLAFPSLPLLLSPSLVVL